MIEITDKIWQEFSNQLFNFILKRVNSRQDAEDILQEAFVKIYKNEHTLVSKKALKAWLYTIVKNTIIDFYRKKGIPTDTFEDVFDLSEEEKKDEDNEINKCISPIISSLPEKYRQAIETVEIKGTSQKELSKKLNISHSGAKSRVQRGRKMVKEMLEKCCYLECDRRGSIIDFKRKGEKNSDYC